MLHIIILSILSFSLVSISCLKNALYFIFQKKKENTQYTRIDILKSIIGTKIVGLIWIFPYKINDNIKNNDQLSNLKDRFNFVSKIQLIIFSLFLIYILLYVIKNG